MAWTAPRTWVTGEVVTAAIMNTHVRDNLDFLKSVGALTHLSMTDATVDLTLTTTETDITGATKTFTTTIDNANYLVVATFRYDVDTASTGVALRGHLRVGATTQASSAQFTDFDDTDWDGMQTQVWQGTVSPAASTTWKLRGSKSAAGGTHVMKFSGTRFVLAVVE